MCHAVRAAGSNVTLIALTRAGSGASTIGSCHTVPVKYLEDAFFVGRVPAFNMSIMLYSLGYIRSKEEDSNIRLSKNSRFDRKKFG